MTLLALTTLACLEEFALSNCVCRDGSQCQDGWFVDRWCEVDPGICEDGQLGDSSRRRWSTAACLEPDGIELGPWTAVMEEQDECTCLPGRKCSSWSGGKEGCYVAAGICQDAEYYTWRGWYSEEACEQQPQNSCDDPHNTAPGCECRAATMHQTQPGQGGCQKCSCDPNGYVVNCVCVVRVRKEIHDMTDDELSRLFTAINTLKAQGEWDRIAEAHERAASHAHGEDIFLPWHRRFHLDVETILQVAAGSCELTLPYWNWALERRSASESDVWKWFGSLNLGNLNADSASCVRDGAFGYGSAFYSGWLVWAGLSDGECVKRQGSNNIAPFDLVMILNKFRHEDFAGTAGFTRVSRMIERTMHDVVHGAIGGPKDGHMGDMKSPYDPVFFLHHGFIDYLWGQWQKMHISEENINHRVGDTIPANGFSAGFQASEVADMKRMKDDNLVTKSITEYACVKYAESSNVHSCPDHSEILRCLSLLELRNELTKVPRVIFEVDGQDACDPQNKDHKAHAAMWLQKSVDSGQMTDDEKEEILRAHESATAAIMTQAPHAVEAESDCDKVLCFSASHVLRECPDDVRSRR